MAAKKKVRAKRGGGQQVRGVANSMPTEMREALATDPRRASKDQAQAPIDGTADKTDWLQLLTEPENKLHDMQWFPEETIVEMGDTTDNYTIGDEIESGWKITAVEYKPDGDKEMEVFDAFTEITKRSPKGKTAYFYRETVPERSAYVSEFVSNPTVACLKVVFLRLRDKQGNRIFGGQTDYAWLMKHGKGSQFENLGMKIMGYFDNGGDSLDMETVKNSSEQTETLS